MIEDKYLIKTGIWISGDLSRAKGTPVWKCKKCKKQFQTKGIARHHKCIKQI